MSLPLSADARAAVDRLDDYRRRQHALQVRRETARRARELRVQAELAAQARRNTHHEPPPTHLIALAFVEDNPGCTTQQVRAELGISERNTRNTLTLLAYHGCVVNTNPVKCRAAVWEYVKPFPKVALAAGAAEAVLTVLERGGEFTSAEVAELSGLRVDAARSALRGLQRRGLASCVVATTGFGRKAVWRATERVGVEGVAA